MFSETCNNFPNMCKMLLNTEKSVISKSEYAAVITQVLKNEFQRSNIKTLMRWTDASSRSIQNWLTGKNMPSAESMIMLMGHSDEMLNACLYLAGRSHIVPMIRFMEMVSIIKEPIEMFEYLRNLTQPDFKKWR